MLRKTAFVLVMALALLLAGPVTAQTVTYTVRAGDMLGAIAERHNCSVDQLRQWNDIDGDMIRVGQALTIYESAGRTSDGFQRYSVASGDTLGGIAERFDVSITDIVGWNEGLEPDSIRVGQELRIRGYGRATRSTSYVVQSGDTLGGIAERYSVSVRDLTRWNSGLDPDRIRVGQEIAINTPMPEVESESVGPANAGRLVNGEQLPPHRGYTIRNEDVAWGTNETVTAILAGFDHMRSSFDRLPRVEMHDLSRREGGEISDHRSHESGRDADIGYYHSGCGQTCEYRDIDGDELDVERQWALLRYWIDNDQVEYVFMDYELQEPLYNWLDENGATDRQLSQWFQYPRGRGSSAGLIRHEPGHADHLHARFSCASDDPNCH